jgi:hypothetical protein
MKSSDHSLLYLIAGLVSGALWFLFPLLFDSGWGIPPGSIGRVAGAFCAMVTGVLISFLFRPAFRRAPLLAFIFLPCVTLPVAIVSFSLLLWLSRLLLGVHFSPAPVGGDLRLLAESYLVYGLLGSGPLLYIFALLNQYAMRSLLNRFHGAEISRGAAKGAEREVCHASLPVGNPAPSGDSP